MEITQKRNGINTFQYKIIVRFNPKYFDDVYSGFNLEKYQNMKNFNSNLKNVETTDEYNLTMYVDFNSIKRTDTYPTFYIGYNDKKELESIKHLVKNICKYSLFTSSYKNTVSIMIDDVDQTFKKGQCWYSKEYIRKPRYPINIISLGRFTDTTGFTHKTLSSLKIHHYIFIEEREKENYEKWVNSEFCEIIIADNFSELKQGGTPMRNFILNYWREKNIDWLWMLDDNIKHFTRNHLGYKKIIKTGEIFSCVEDFINDTQNVGVCSFFDDQMVATTNPVSINTQCFSCLFINLTTGLDFEFKYNEDHIFSIRNICSGYNTIKFHHFGYRKPVSGSIKGGNTDTIYANDGYNRKCDETIKYITEKINNNEFILKAGKTIDNFIKIKSLKNKPRHLQLVYNCLQNYNNPLIQNIPNDVYKYDFILQ